MAVEAIHFPFVVEATFKSLFTTWILVDLGAIDHWRAYAWRRKRGRESSGEKSNGSWGARKMDKRGKISKIICPYLIELWR